MMNTPPGLMLILKKKKAMLIYKMWCKVILLSNGLSGVKRFAALCLFALAQSFKFTTNVDGANSTKPLLYAGTVD